MGCLNLWPENWVSESRDDDTWTRYQLLDLEHLADCFHERRRRGDVHLHFSFTVRGTAALDHNSTSSFSTSIRTRNACCVEGSSRCPSRYAWPRSRCHCSSCALFSLCCF